MTQITGFIQPARRPGELGVHSVDHFCLSVPDLKPAEMFYRAFGLDVREEGNGLDLYTAGHNHRWIRVSEAPAKKNVQYFVRRFPRGFGANAPAPSGSRRPSNRSSEGV